MIFTKVSAAVCAALLVLSACAPGESDPPTAEPQAQSQSAGTSAPAAKEITTSPNVKLVANLPRPAPLNGPLAWNSDLAFQGDYAYVGNFDGFSVVDIADPAKPKVVSTVSCPGQQNDVSVYGNLLILSVDETRTDETCTSKHGDAWEGLRLFDITDKKQPKYISSVATKCGSHTHTMVPGKDGQTLYVYVSSPGPAPSVKTCPPPHRMIQVVAIPLQDPRSAKVSSSEDIFPDGQESGGFTGCHDVTAFPEKDLAAAACFGDGVLLDIADPAKPKVLQQIRDTENFDLWHSATFNNDGTKVVFGDELGGGGMATCDSRTPATKGANAIYDVVNGKLERRGYFKMPREQTARENCVAHNGSLIPVKGKDIMVQGWYQGGVSIWDFTDSAAPREIGFFDRGPSTAGTPIAGSWSAYYYNGYIYSSDILEGLDVIQIDDPLTDPAKQVKMDDFNVQTQKTY
ncbi:beta-propeller domain-containing protein [Nonomuraea sp. NPDC050310]|uniref:LVIVD repeat-containing protein n=1 Tax=unclassified Nonomuraea TaxID=2593643 RepID=UPI0033D39C94